MDSQYMRLVCTWLLLRLLTAEQEGCTTPQYLEIGKEGLVSCSFHESFFGVFWYNSTDTVSNKPILKFINSIKSGVGYTSGEYDIHPNGSLIINNVSLVHSHVFTVAKFSSQSDDPVRFSVSVISAVIPMFRRPVINECGDERECYLQVNGPYEVSCSVIKSRPAISVQWVERTVFGDRNVSSKMSRTQEGATFTTISTATDLFNVSPNLIHLVCKTEASPNMLQRTQASIIIELKTSNHSKSPPVTRFLSRGSRLTLPCSDDETVAIVWKKMSSSDEHYDILLYAWFAEEQFTKVYCQRCKLGDTGALNLPEVDIQDEGIYRCVYSNGITSGIKQHEILIKIDPGIPYPVVDGCNEQQHCVLDIQKEGNLTCSVTGIRPQVLLEWKMDDSMKSLISFDKDKLTIKNDEDTFTILLISQYRIISTLPTRIQLACTVPDSSTNSFSGTTEVDMSYAGITEDPVKYQSPWLLIFSIVVVVVLLSCLTVGCVAHWARRKLKENFTFKKKEEEEEMLQKATPENDLSGNTQMFLKQIASKYKEFYMKVQPIPYIRHLMYCVDDVFVEGGMKLLSSKEIFREVDEKMGEFNKGKERWDEAWEKIESYRHIFTDERLSSTRRILEGAPGYGKSTLALQLAHDWCKEDGADASNADIFILLRLRQLKGISSIFHAIKLILLPESTLTAFDIEKIINNSESVVVVLDGYDEYPERKSDCGKEVINIIKGEKFSHIEVILTTRTSVLPEEYSPLTKRIKLTGFNEKARTDYIKKAVVGDDLMSAQQVKEHLDKNPVLADLCQVPLIFVLFAHMSHVMKNFQEIHSVTSLFGYMIACFHNHLRNKEGSENENECDSFEKNHGMLDKVAFEGLSRKHHYITWWKDDLCQQLGEKFYDHYVSLGILVEERVLDIPKNPIEFASELSIYKTEVRFYHKLFCEWYAAHYLSQKAKDIVAEDCSDLQNADLSSKHHDISLHLDPLEVPYLYRFACGLEPFIAHRIIGHFNKKEDTRMFAILCSLEQDLSGDAGLKTLTDLCSNDILIKEDSSLLLQRSIVQLLQISSKKKISISRLWIIGCYSSVDVDTDTIRLQSHHRIPVLPTLKELWIRTRNRKMTEKEINDLFLYSSKCSMLEKLRFFNCLMPQSFQDKYLSGLRSKRVQVLWETRPTILPRYVLDLNDGQWKNRKTDVQMTNEDYEEEVKYAEDRRDNQNE